MDHLDSDSLRALGFTDFNVDLSSLSPLSSSPLSSSSSQLLQPLTSSTPLALFSTTSPFLPLPPPPLSSIPVCGLPDAEPGLSFMGRGTPIDPHRRGDWSGQLIALEATRTTTKADTWTGFTFAPGTNDGKDIPPNPLIDSNSGNDAEWEAFLENLLASCVSAIPQSIPHEHSDAGAGNPIPNPHHNTENVTWFELGLGGPIPTPAGVSPSITAPVLSPVGLSDGEGFEGQPSSTLSFALG